MAIFPGPPPPQTLMDRHAFNPPSSPYIINVQNIWHNNTPVFGYSPPILNTHTKVLHITAPFVLLKMAVVSRVSTDRQLINFDLKINNVILSDFSGSMTIVGQTGFYLNPGVPWITDEIEVWARGSVATSLVLSYEGYYL